MSAAIVNSGPLRAPFPYFGGKRTIADTVWRAFGSPKQYIEPFCGSAAVLLSAHKPASLEVIGDANGFIANFWRAVVAQAEEVARWADYPVSHCCPIGTMISTPRGAVAIEDLEAGQEVWGERDGLVVRSRVVALKRSVSADPFVQIGALRLTGNHPVWTSNGYVRADCVRDGMTLRSLLELESDAALGHLHSERSTDTCYPVRGDHVSAEDAASRAPVSRAKNGQDAPRLLDTIVAEFGYNADLFSHPDRGGHWVAGSGACADRGPSGGGLRIGEPHGRRGGHSGACDLAGDASAPIGSVEWRTVQAGASAGDAREASLGGDPSEDRGGRRGSAHVRGDEGGARSREHGAEDGAGTTGALGCGEARLSFDRSAEGEDRRIDDHAEAGGVPRYRRDVPVCEGDGEGPRSGAALGLSGAPQGVPLQRAEPGVCAARVVYNFETDTGNYFAEGILVHNCDLGARHVWMMGEREALGAALQDPHWPGDAKLAGWWLWGQCAWIGSGWCEWTGQVPHVSNAGRGIQATGQVPHVSDAGRGIQATGQVPHVGNAGMGAYDPWTSSGRVAMRWLRELADRMERVRVVHGDWDRCLNNNYGAELTAIFLDPPYKGYEKLYGVSDPVAAECEAWAKDNAGLRVALCGHRGDYDLPGWRVHEWERARLTYSGGATTAQECIWFSPACLPLVVKQGELFGRITIESEVAR